MASELIYKEEINMAVPAHRVWKGIVLDSENIIREIMPEAIKSIQVLEGDGRGVGTIQIVHFGEVSPMKTSKQRIDVIDEENYIFQYTVLEIEDFDGLVDSVKKVIKIEPGSHPEGRSTVYKYTNTYYTKGEQHHSAIKDRIKDIAKKSETAFFKAAENYLLSHPDKYN
ncbi:major strawberry allergen Fra a 1-3-like [Andrographis paniculata]|uniref:major strawberry allergen Fra a 1-3-like n=1 Tax=Andrographis paniculata TaxID=175694 RepID=UPI0021E828C6|nr:major strawberry allergen Fra a 1-3-like [Andrographis paniculata]